MALNIVNNFNNAKFENNQFTTYKHISKLPLISMQTNKNFVLIQNKKGKILNKPVFSGYTKNKLSSIPKDVEIILLNKEKDEILFKNDKSSNTSRTKDYIFNNQIYINPYTKSNDYTMGKEMTPSASGRISSSGISDNINNKTILPASTDDTKSASAIKANHRYINKVMGTKTPNYWKFYKKVEKSNYNDISNNQNNLSFDEYKSQFYPGPSDYNVEKSFDKINQQNKFRYKSLFTKEINSNKKNKIKKDNSPGPGSYLKMNNILNNNNKHLSINLGRKEKRFRNLFNNNNPLSPWFYSSSSSINITNKNNKNNKPIKSNTNTNNSNNNLLNENKNNNKDCYDYRYYVIKEVTSDTGEKKHFYLEEKNHKYDDNTNKYIKIIKPFDNIKFKEKRKFNILLKKYINTIDTKDYEVPGPGQYNIYMGFDKILKDNAIEQLKNINKQEKLIPENVWKEFSLSKKDPGLLGNESLIEEKYLKKGMGSKSCENIFGQENSKNGSGTLPFLSKKKRIEFHDDLLLKHTPGPCYYYNEEITMNNLPRKKLKGVFKFSSY